MLARNRSLLRFDVEITGVQMFSGLLCAYPSELQMQEKLAQGSLLSTLEEKHGVLPRTPGSVESRLGTTQSCTWISVL